MHLCGGRPAASCISSREHSASGHRGGDGPSAGTRPRVSMVCAEELRRCPASPRGYAPPRMGGRPRKSRCRHCAVASLAVSAERSGPRSPRAFRLIKKTAGTDSAIEAAFTDAPPVLEDSFQFISACPQFLRWHIRAQHRPWHPQAQHDWRGFPRLALNLTARFRLDWSRPWPTCRRPRPAPSLLTQRTSTRAGLRNLGRLFLPDRRSGPGARSTKLRSCRARGRSTTACCASRRPADHRNRRTRVDHSTARRSSTRRRDRAPVNGGPRGAGDVTSRRDTRCHHP